MSTILTLKYKKVKSFYLFFDKEGVKNFCNSHLFVGFSLLTLRVIASRRIFSNGNFPICSMSASPATCCGSVLAPRSQQDTEKK